jgi:hypothetical protein
MNIRDDPDHMAPEERLADVGPSPDAPLDRSRHAAVIVEHPRLVVVESPGTADPGAVYGALELLVKWAVRAHQGRKPAMQDSQPIAASAAENAGDLT